MGQSSQGGELMLTADYQINKVNALLEQQQARLNQFKKILSLSSLMANGKNDCYDGTCDEVTDLLEKRRNFIENRRALIDDILFLIHQQIKHIVELKLSEAERTEMVKRLEDNKKLLRKRHQVLQNLDTLYKSLIIEPAIIKIPDGERKDPHHFRVIIDPITSLSPKEATVLKRNWMESLKKLEAEVITPLTLLKLN